jgi:DNA-binding transcriptional LysR family regulator
MALASYPGDLLDHLKAFSTLCRWVERGERGAFSRAAGELALDVSVLRRRMQTLATFVGAGLLEGRGNGLRLTAAGTRARVQAVRALEAAAELALVAVDDVGPLRIACTGTIFAEVLPPALRALRTAYPRLLFRVKRAGATASRELIATGEVDFAIVRAADRPVGVSSLRLAADRLWLATPEGSALSTARRVSMAAVAREPLVGYSAESSTMRRVMAVLAPHGAAPWLEVDGKAAALAYVSAGLGNAFVSAVATQRPQRAGVALRDVTTSFGAVSFWLVWREAAALSLAHRRFVDELRSAEGRSTKDARSLG